MRSSEFKCLRNHRTIFLEEIVHLFLENGKLLTIFYNAPAPIGIRLQLSNFLDNIFCIVAKQEHSAKEAEQKRRAIDQTKGREDQALEKILEGVQIFSSD